MGGRESIPGEIRLCLSGPTTVHDATRAAQDFGSETKLDGADRSRLAILVEEMVTNLYDHGGLGAEDVVELELRHTRDGISLTLTDPGTSFDPGFAHADRPISDRGGGAGLRLVQSWASQIDYQSADGRNILRLLIPHRAPR